MPLACEEKIKVTQRKLLELAEKKLPPEDYEKEKKIIIYDGYWKEIASFQPAFEMERLLLFVPQVPKILTSSCGVKLKNVAVYGAV